jgi:hypothetical protein
MNRLSYNTCIMEMSQGNSLCSYLKQAKMWFFFYIIFEQKSRTDHAWEVGTTGKGWGESMEG